MLCRIFPQGCEWSRITRQKSDSAAFLLWTWGLRKAQCLGPCLTSSPLASSSSPCPSSFPSRRLLKPPSPEPPHDQERHGPVNMALNWTSGNLFLSELPHLEIPACLPQQHRCLLLRTAGKGASFIIHVCWEPDSKYSTEPPAHPVCLATTFRAKMWTGTSWLEVFEGSSERWVPGLQRPVVP